MLNVSVITKAGSAQANIRLDCTCDLSKTEGYTVSYSGEEHVNEGWVCICGPFLADVDL